MEIIYLGKMKQKLANIKNLQVINNLLLLLLDLLAHNIKKNLIGLFPSES